MGKQIFDTGYVRYNTYDQSYEFITCDTANEMFCCISKIICFNDIDETYEIDSIFLNGRKVEYVGWQPCMHYEYRFTDTEEQAWEGWFEHWDH